MNFQVIGGSVASAVVGGLITGTLAWMKFSTAMVVLQRDVDRFEEDCAVCRGNLAMEDAKIVGAVSSLQTSVQNHHEAGHHYLPADRILNDERWKEVRDRLASIESFLRKGVIRHVEPAP